MANGRLMQSFPADPAHSHRDRRTHPALTSVADEVCATVARLFAHVGTLALIGILAVHGWDQLQTVLAKEKVPGTGWRTTHRWHRAFTLGELDPSEKSEAYTIFRHPLGGRKDILRRTGANDKVLAELEIYRIGAEFDPARPPTANLATLMNETRPLETAGIIDSKFGPMVLFRPIGAMEAGSCVSFMRRIDDPALVISGFSCQRDTLPARRVAIGCLVNRLTLLAGGNEPKLAQLFARAELQRGKCTASENWMTDAENPKLRGTF